VCAFGCLCFLSHYTLCALTLAVYHFQHNISLYYARWSLYRLVQYTPDN